MIWDWGNPSSSLIPESTELHNLGQWSLTSSSSERGEKQDFQGSCPALTFGEGGFRDPACSSGPLAGPQVQDCKVTIHGMEPALI